MGQNKLPTTFRVKEGGIERFVVELKMGGRVKHARIVSVETPPKKCTLQNVFEKEYLIK